MLLIIIQIMTCIFTFTEVMIHLGIRLNPESRLRKVLLCLVVLKEAFVGHEALGL